MVLIERITDEETARQIVFGDWVDLSLEGKARGLTAGSDQSNAVVATIQHLPCNSSNRHT